MQKAIVILLFLSLSLVRADDISHPHIKIGAGPFKSLDELRAARQLRGTISLKPLTAAELRDQYNIAYNATGGAGKTVALIDAYGYPTAESDLAQFNEMNNLPACTTANGCFKKVNQTGGTHYPPDAPPAQFTWGQEAALDIQAVRAFAPGAKILLVVCNDGTIPTLMIGLQYALKHADYISISVGGPEPSVAIDKSYFSNVPSTVSIFASSGDDGSHAINYPGSSPHVVSVGGTSLFTTAKYKFSSEHAWNSSAGSSTGGCSRNFDASAAQAAFSQYAALGCNGKRAIPDVAMDADSLSGLIVVFNSTVFAAGGTSLASPLFAARSALYGGVITQTQVYETNSPITFRDITIGQTGGPKNYTAGPGMDLTTGRGSWINYP